MRVLHAGAGGGVLPDWLRPCEEVRLDIAPATAPDVVASITDLGDLGEFNVVYCTHVLEHLHRYEVWTALREFLRVLTPGGYAMILVPDLEDVRPTEEVVYESPGGPVTGLDMIYGHGLYVGRMPFMAHHTGFIRETLSRTMHEAGFRAVEVRRLSSFNLIAVGVK